jgi:hypothetical protein
MPYLEFANSSHFLPPLLTPVTSFASCPSKHEVTRKEITTIMKLFSFRSLRFSLGILATLFLLAASAQAGPPLICHTIEIGQAKSLPWTNHGWNLTGNENYDLKNLVPDTLAILDSGAPVLVRMETLRRATLYARQNPQVAKELLTKLVARATASENAGRPDALALFDAGYLAECYKQWIGKNLPHMTDNLPMDANPAANFDGYALVTKAIGLRGQDPEMEFAAALITLDGPQASHEQHVLRAIGGAKDDSLLAQNLKTRYMGDGGLTVADLLSKSAKPNQ